MLAEFATRLGTSGLDVMLPLVCADLMRITSVRLTYRSAVVVGNTRRLWELLEQPLQRADDPIDRMVERTIADAAAVLPCAAIVHFGHKGPPYMPLVAAAHAAGLKVGDCGLAIHPTYGPWMALRALVELDCDPVSLPPGPSSVAACVCTEGCMKRPGAAPGLRRRACPVGRDWMYSDAQARYHDGD